MQEVQSVLVQSIGFERNSREVAVEESPGLDGVSKAEGPLAVLYTEVRQ